jgi:hypothetical protein
LGIGCEAKVLARAPKLLPRIGNWELGIGNDKRVTRDYQINKDQQINNFHQQLFTPKFLRAKIFA